VPDKELDSKFQHFTVMADGIVGQLKEGFDCRPGRAVMSMKVWAADMAESIDMIRVIGRQIGFTVDGETHVYETEPEQPPPGDHPRGYDIKFVPYDEEPSSIN
jgi:hypothetical protein